MKIYLLSVTLLLLLVPTLTAQTLRISHSAGQRVYSHGDQVIDRGEYTRLLKADPVAGRTWRTANANAALSVVTGLPGGFILASSFFKRGQSDSNKFGYKPGGSAPNWGWLAVGAGLSTLSIVQGASASSARRAAPEQYNARHRLGEGTTRPHSGWP